MTADARVTAWWRGRPDGVRAVLMTFGAMIFFSAMLVFIKLAGQRIPVVEVMTLRQIIMQALVCAVAGQGPVALLATSRPGLQALRGVFGVGAMWASFLAIVALPIALATALSFTYAIFVTLGAALVLRQPVGLRSWLATAVGFAGMLVMLKPGGEAAPIALAWGLIGAASSAAMILTLRGLARDDSTATTLTWQGLVTLLATLVPTVIWWVTPTATEALLLLLIGVTGMAGHWLLVQAYGIADAARLAPLDFVRLLLMVASGVLVFGESIDAAILLGGLIVTGSTVLALRETPRAPTRGTP